MHCSAILLQEVCRMVGNPYYPANLQEISWRDLQWVEMARRALPDAMEEVECGSHSNPNQVDDGAERTLDSMNSSSTFLVLYLYYWPYEFDWFLVFLGAFLSH